MAFRKIINSLNQIHCAEHVDTMTGALRHISWMFRRMFNKFPVELEISNSKIKVYDPSGVAALVNCMGIYDYNNINLIKLLLKELGQSGVFFDVGSNIGSYTLVASEVATAKIFSFEPGTKAFSELKRNIELNKRSNVKLLNFAVSDKESVLILTNGQEISTNKVVNDPEIAQKTVYVKSKTLDQVCREYDVQPNIVKIDVEGHELKVLEGYYEFIEDTDMLLIEEGQNTQICQWLLSFGFEGPFYFHLNKSAFLSTTQKRPEDPIFFRPNFFEKYDKNGVIKVKR